jgi:hypothetical protein
VSELGVGSVGLLLLIDGPITHVLDFQGRRNDQHFVQAALLIGRQYHPSDPGIDRETSKMLADIRQAAMCIHRPRVL